MTNPELVLSPTDFIAISNQTLEHVFGNVQIEGELANFKISKNRWVYFDIKDDISKVACFGSVYTLPGPLKDGMMIRVSGQPRLHPQFGFKVNIASVIPSGEGSIRKVYELLKAKLIAEGLFLDERKRVIVYPPSRIGLITSSESAAYADFLKITNNRWPYMEIDLYDVQVQGEQATAQIVDAIVRANKMSDLAEALVITRGGGSADDLSAFNDERVVRAIASSRIPTLVAIGHEVDLSLCEMAADKRASTPSNAAELLVPNKKEEIDTLTRQKTNLKSLLLGFINNEANILDSLKTTLIGELYKVQRLADAEIGSYRQLLNAYNPSRILKRGYAIVKLHGNIINRASRLKVDQHIGLSLYDADIDATISKIDFNLNRD